MIGLRKALFIGIVFLWLSLLTLMLMFLSIIETLYAPTGGKIWFIGKEFTFFLSMVFMILAAVCISIRSKEH